MQVKAPRGTYDILPEAAYKWNKVEKVLKETAAYFGFQEIRTPIFEHTELFERGVGETTDVVSKEMYTFVDKGERSLTLRPENTASCVRAFVEHKLYNGVLPFKCFYNGPMFRYDRPQTGRYRQFHQFGIEAVGSNSPYLDAEVITLMTTILNNLGIKDYELHLNSVGCPECRKVYRSKLLEFMQPVRDKLCKDCQTRVEKNPLRVLDCKREECQKGFVGFPHIYDFLCSDCGEHYALVKKALDINAIKFVHDNNLVRGLDYYTNTAFEIIIPTIGAQSAVGGGGRYNGLVKECGGPDLPGIGFAIGIERLMLAIDNPYWVKNPAIQVLIAVQDPAYTEQAFSLLNVIRQNGIRADKDYHDRSVKAQMKYADKIGAEIVVIIGQDEIENKFFTVRNMKNGEQQRINDNEIIPSLKAILGADWEDRT